MRLHFAILTLSLVACGGTTFQSGNKGAARAATEGLQLVCGANNQLQTPPVYKGISGTKVKVTGEFCSIKETIVSNDPISVAFVLDYSGSMSENDPEIAGSCGRLEAARAIVNKMLTDSKGQANAKIAVVHFHQNAEVSIQPTVIQNIQASLTTANFCGYQLSGGPNTNYEAGFNSARDLLTTAVGKKLVYFITDGEPTLPNSPTADPNSIISDNLTARTAGLTAAQSLRSSVQDLQLNAIFLDKAPASIIFSPKEYLDQLTGDPTRVRVVSDAQGLAAQITSFETPSVKQIDLKQVQGEIRADGFGSRPVEIASVQPDPVREGIFIFETKPVELFGTVGQQVQNRLILTVAGGGVPETAGTIVFQKEL